MAGWLFALALVVLAEGVVRLLDLSTSVAAPSDAARALMEGMADGTLSGEIATTLGTYVQGLALAVAIGVPLGVAIGSFRAIEDASSVVVEFLRPIPAVALIPLARKGQALDEAYAAAHQLGTADHHLLQKAAGWLLREAGKTDAARLDSFLRQSGRALGRTTVSYAIERFPPRARKALLAATRGA